MSQTFYVLSKMKNKTPRALTTIYLIIIFVLCANQNYTLVQADLIEETCNKIFFLSDACVMFLRSDGRSYRASDVKGLARIMLDKTIAKATDTIQLMEKLEGEATDPELKGYLSLCLCFYAGAVEDYFQKSLENLDTNSFLEAARLAGYGAKKAQNLASLGFDSSSTVWKKSKDLENLGFVTQGIIALLT